MTTGPGSQNNDEATMETDFFAWIAASGRERDFD